ncbi:MAG: hypothetical protein R3C53_28475 [Pirellulaceae bacterium]
MSGTKPLETAITIPPIGVVVRQSSDALAIDDEDIAKAVRFIRQPRSQAITVAEVVRHIAISRTTVDRKFKELVGHSLAEEIRRSRRERAKTLLAVRFAHCGRRSENGLSREHRTIRRLS